MLCHVNTMKVGLKNRIVLAHYPKNLEMYKIWGGHLFKNNKWDVEFRSIENDEDIIFKEFNSEYKSEFLAINGKTITFGEARIINILGTLHKPLTTEEFCEYCKEKGDQICV